MQPSSATRTSHVTVPYSDCPFEFNKLRHNATLLRETWRSGTQACFEKLMDS